MNQKFKNFKVIVVMFILIIILIELLVNSKSVMNSVLFSFDIWIKNIFPSLFPMFVLSGVLINYGFPEILSEVLKPVMRLFKSNSKCAFIFAMSIISGFPSSAKYVRELYEKKEINIGDAEKVLTYSHFSNPLFILGTIALLLNNKDVAFLILIVHYSTNIIIGLIFRNYHQNSYYDYKVNVKNIKNQMTSFHNNNIGGVISNSIVSAIDTLLLILGTVTVFLVLSNLICNHINLQIPIINGILEATQGIKVLSMTNLSLKVKAALMTFFLSFGGLSVHMQIKSILSSTNISLKPFFIARIIHSFLASSIIYLLL